MLFNNNEYNKISSNKNSLFQLNNVNKDYFEQCLTEILNETSLLQMNQYIQHGDTTCLWHSIAVAYYTFCFFSYFNIKCNYKSLIYGALLHDYFLYDWHENDKSHRLHGFYHPTTALNNALNHYDLNKIERDIIKRHMFPLTIIPPKYRESIFVSIYDKICSTYETFNSNTYLKLKSEISL